MDSALRPMSTSEVLDRTFHLYVDLQFMLERLNELQPQQNAVGAG